MDYNAILGASVYKERNFKSTFFPNDVTRRSPDTRLKDRLFRNCVSSRLLTKIANELETVAEQNIPRGDREATT